MQYSIQCCGQASYTSGTNVILNVVYKSWIRSKTVYGEVCEHDKYLGLILSLN